jgi:hypothetical protein
VDDTQLGLVVHRYGRATSIAALVVTLGWHLGNDLPQTIAGWPRYHPAVLVGGVWLGLLAVAVVFGTTMLRGRPTGPVAAGLAAAALLLGTGLSQYAIYHGRIYDPANWAWRAVCWFALLVLWYRRLGELIAFCLANGALGGLVLVLSGQADQIGVSRFIMVTYGVSVLPITLFVGGRVLTATARRAALAKDAQARVDTARLAAEVVHQARGARFRSARQTSARLLAGLASGELDLDSPATQRECRVAAARLRRLIAETDDVPEPLLHELRACADTAERRGIEVDLAMIGSVPPLPVEVRRALTDAPIELLASAQTRARITVVAAPGDVAVAVVADAATGTGEVPPPPGTGPASVTASIDREGGQVWVQTRWPAR